MGMVRCDNGHYYDTNKHDKCPQCGIFAGNDADDVKTVAIRGNIALKRDVTQEDKPKDDDTKTVAKYTKSNGNDFVVGWLVCIEGAQKGRDYRLFHGRNFMGRDSSMDICVQDDMQISRKNHCSVIYEERNNKFYIMPDENVVYIDDVMINGAVELANGQEVVVGESRFVFIAFCGGERKWER